MEVAAIKNEIKINFCIIYQTYSKKVKGRKFFPTLCNNHDITTNIKSNAVDLGELALVTRIGNNQPIYYHRLCKISMENKLRLTKLAQKKEKN